MEMHSKLHLEGQVSPFPEQVISWILTSKCRLVPIKFSSAVCRGAIVMFLKSFTQFSLSRLWVKMKGAAHLSMMCTPQSNARGGSTFHPNPQFR